MLMSSFYRSFFFLMSFSILNSFYLLGFEFSLLLKVFWILEEFGLRVSWSLIILSYEICFLDYLNWSKELLALKSFPFWVIFELGLTESLIGFFDRKSSLSFNFIPSFNWDLVLLTLGVIVSFSCIGLFVSFGFVQFLGVFIFLKSFSEFMLAERLEIARALDFFNLLGSI